MKRLIHIPYLLILFRLLLAPVVLYLAYKLRDESRIILVVLIFLGILSDIFDGIIARRQKISTVTLRRMDSQVDLVFWLSIGVSCYLLNPGIIVPYKAGIIAVIAMEALCYVASLLKFGREMCTHAFLSKIWGILLFVCCVSVIGFNYGGLLLEITIFWGILSQIDVLLIILILPKWKNDIPSSYHAHLIRKGIAFKRNKLFHDE